MPKEKSKKIIEKEGSAKKAETIYIRQQKEKDRILLEFQNTNNISIVCARSKMHRSKFYRLYNEDVTFRKDVDEAREMGQKFLVDGVEARLVNKATKEDSLPAMKFFLQHNSEKYRIRKIPEDTNKLEELEDKKRKEIATAAINFSGLNRDDLIKDFEAQYSEEQGLDLVGT